MYRRSFLISTTVTLLLAGCGSATSSAQQVVRIDAALSAATQFLVRQQSADGAWRSDVYGPFREGDALTPAVLLAISEMPLPEIDRDVIERATGYLAAMVAEDGTIREPQGGLAYPLYTAAATVLTLAGETDPHLVAIREAWVRYLLERQLTDPLGWQLGDMSYGGWGYASQLPRRPLAGDPLPPLAEPNLSATVFALSALRAGGVPSDHVAFERARVFVSRCQNLPPNEASGDARFDDGGFFFMQHDPVRNKAGVAGTDRHGRERLISYGSTTADGLRALVLSGVKADDRRVVAAWKWLAENFESDSHPGAYTPQREAARPSLYFYYCQSLMQALADTETGPPIERRQWAEALADALAARQRSDGSWINSAVDVREDDPLVATSLAVRALAACRQVLAEPAR